MEIPIKIVQVSKSDLTEIEALQASSFPAEKQQPSHILEESIRKSADTFLLARDENQLLGYVLGSDRHSNWCEMVSHYGFDLHFSDDQ